MLVASNGGQIPVIFSRANDQSNTNKNLNEDKLFIQRLGSRDIRSLEKIFKLRKFYENKNKAILPPRLA